MVFVLVPSDIARTRSSMCVVAMYGSPYDNSATWFFFAASRISCPSSTNHLGASLNWPFVIDSRFLTSSVLIGLVNCSKYTVSDSEIIFRALSDNASEPPIPRPTNHSIIFRFLRRAVVLRSEEHTSELQS